MNLNQSIRTFLTTYKNKTISLSQLQDQCTGQVTYTDFAQVIQGLLQEEVLTPITSSGLSPNPPKLPYKFRFNRPLLNKHISQAIHLAQTTYHKVNLSNYYHLSQSDWEQDLPYIKQIHGYLEINDHLPKEEVLRTELSFQLVGDEKWIEQGRGQSILERLGLWDQLKIQKHPDPLMLAISTDSISPSSSQPTYHHLVVENKSTYYALLEELPNSLFTSLIYGQGWKITANITQLTKQLPTLKGKHKVHYFGDLDYEGIAIWHKLSQVTRAHIARPFYTALLRQKESHGAKNQTRQETAMEAFLSHFKREGETINNLLKKGSYYPQEAIKEDQLRQIFRTYTLEDQQEE